ncbi:MAG: hypothetical protein ACP6IQ_03325 [Candidatus Njordarchaeia archaeon]
MLRESINLNSLNKNTKKKVDGLMKECFSIPRKIIRRDDRAKAWGIIYGTMKFFCHSKVSDAKKNFLQHVSGMNKIKIKQVLSDVGRFFVKIGQKDSYLELLKELGNVEDWREIYLELLVEKGFYNDALSILANYNDPKVEAKIYSLIARHINKNKQIEQAKKFINDAENALMKIRNVEDKLEAYMNFIEALIELGFINDAKKFNEKFLELIKEAKTEDKLIYVFEYFSFLIKCGIINNKAELNYIIQTFRKHALQEISKEKDISVPNLPSDLAESAKSLGLTISPKMTDLLRISLLISSLKDDLFLRLVCEGRIEEAKKTLEEEDIKKEIARALIECGKIDEAMQYIEELESKSNKKYYLTEIMTAYIKKNELQKARKIFEDKVKSFRSIFDLSAVIKSLLENGFIDETEYYLEAFLENKPLNEILTDKKNLYEIIGIIFEIITSQKESNLSQRYVEKLSEIAEQATKMVKKTREKSLSYVKLVCKLSIILATLSIMQS